MSVERDLHRYPDIVESPGPWDKDGTGQRPGLPHGKVNLCILVFRLVGEGRPIAGL